MTTTTTQKCYYHLIILLLLTSIVIDALSQESLRELSRLPHMQRHWLVVQHNRNKQQQQLGTTIEPIIDHQEEEEDDRDDEINQLISSPSTTEMSSIVLVFSAASDEIKLPSSTTTTTRAVSEVEWTTIGSTLSISEAKEKLKARRNKNRKKTMTQTPPPPSTSNLSRQSATFDLLYPVHLPAELTLFSTLAEESEAIEAKKHIQRMHQSGAWCSQPSARLVYLRHHQNVRYLPECTWLHRCSDDTGCCTDESQTCSPANIESISLPFFALTLAGGAGGGHETKRTVTRLTFENHTRCECVGRNADLMPRTEPDKSPPPPPIANKRRSPPLRRLLPSRNHFSKCRCPWGYNQSIGRRHKRHCVCQCLSQSKCTRTNRGLDTFPSRDQRCIESKRCQVPQCHYGRYLSSIGRCPKSKF